MPEEDRLNSLLADLDDPRRRETALNALAGMTDDPRIIEPLAQVLRSGDAGNALAYRARRTAAELLGKTGSKRAIPALTLALEDTSSSVKAAAALALSQLNDVRVAEPLVDVLADRNVDVRIAAARALAMLAQSYDSVPLEPIITLLADPEDTVREVAAGIMRDKGAAAYDRLIDALDNPNSTIRGAAATLLGELEDERARKALQNAAYDDDSSWVRSRAEWALDQLPPPPLPRVKREPVTPDPPRNPIDIVRANTPQHWPGFSDAAGKTTPQPQSSPPTSTPDEMNAAKIQQMLDALDVRLINGEISQETYEKLAARWQERLNNLKS